VSRTAFAPAPVRPAIDHADQPVAITSREELIYLLNEAAELEHGACVTYLFAAFSLKEGTDEALTPEQALEVSGWKRTIVQIATQEMAHLTLVTNLLSSIGGAPHLARPAMPHHLSYAPEIQLELTRLDENALERFLYLERPEGLSIDDLAGDIRIGRLSRIWMPEPTIAPLVQPFSAVGQLYRGIESGCRGLAGKIGEDRLFIGSPVLQATAEQFRMPELLAVTDLQSALATLETIVVEGEGQRNYWRSAHFGRFVSILDRYRALRRVDRRFDPSRPVVPNPCTHPREDFESYAGVTRIDTPSTRAVADLFDACYELMLQLLERLFDHDGESAEEMGTVAQVAIGLMADAVAPLGELLTKLPASVQHPDRTAGAPFAASGRTEFTSHKRAAWTALGERLIELVDVAGSITLDRGGMGTLTSVANALRGFAGRLEQSR
jgi:Ferritin-like